jgi:hypothetical protein
MGIDIIIRRGEEFEHARREHLPEMLISMFSH